MTDGEARRLDFDFLACRIMKEFGWTIDYVLSISYPVFFYLTSELRRVRSDHAIDAFFLPYGAAKFGGKCSRELFRAAGSFFLNDGEDDPDALDPEAVEAARNRLQAINDEHSRRLAEAAVETEVRH